MTASCAVLVVDDDDGLRDMLVDALELEGMQVRAAANGAQALAVLEHWHPQVILLDLNMPVMDGWAFREAQRARPTIAQIPVIVYSASFHGRVKMEGFDEAAFLSKPCSLDQLFDIIQSVLQI
jgi:CheY-like chemotaxis protein